MLRAGQSEEHGWRQNITIDELALQIPFTMQRPHRPTG